MVRPLVACTRIALFVGLLTASSAAADENGSLLPPPGEGKKIDFRNDVAPILQQHCVDCHGPELQMAELRLDQRQFSLADDGRDLIKPGNNAESLLIQRLIDPKLGILMPPTFPFFPGEKAGLAAEKIQILKRWIDQGAPWPKDISLAVESKQAASDPAVNALFASIRDCDHAAVEKRLTDELISSRDKHGSTPLIHAALYADATMIKLLLARGSDVNAINEDGATALSRAAGDLAKGRLLLDQGAKVDVRSAMGRTPLLIASNYPGNVETVRLLLAHGAKVTDQDSYGETCLTSAAKRGDAELVETLIAAGADLFAGGRPPLVWAAEEGNLATIACLLKHGAGKNKEIASMALCSAAARGPMEAVKLLLDHGADSNAKSPLAGYTPLMMAAYSENNHAETVQLLLAAGADPKVQGQNGETALSLAKKRGQSAIVKLLEMTSANR